MKATIAYLIGVLLMICYCSAIVASTVLTNAPQKTEQHQRQNAPESVGKMSLKKMDLFRVQPTAGAMKSSTGNGSIQ